MNSCFKKLPGLLVLAAFFLPAAAHACSACFGESGSPMARGLGWGVVVLFGIVLAVLGGIVAFAVYLAKRAARISAETPEFAEAEPDDPYGLFKDLPKFSK